MKNKIIYISILVILCVGSFYLGWYEHKPVPNFKIDDTTEYEKNISSLDAICPFVSTAFTGDCLDKQINKQKQQYDLLSKEILDTAKAKLKAIRVSGLPLDDLELIMIIDEIPRYNKLKDDYISSLCSLKNASITGTAIVEESRKCWMYFNSSDTQMLENIKTDVERTTVQ